MVLDNRAEVLKTSGWSANEILRLEGFSTLGRVEKARLKIQNDRKSALKASQAVAPAPARWPTSSTISPMIRFTSKSFGV